MSTTATLPVIHNLPLSGDELELVEAFANAAHLMQMALERTHCERCEISMCTIAGNMMLAANVKFVAAHGLEGYERLIDRMKLLRSVVE